MYNSSSIIGVLLLSALGCAARPGADALSASERSAAASRDVDVEAARLAKLEARLADFEREQARRERAEAANEQRKVLQRLDRLIALNERLLEKELAAPGKVPESELAPRPSLSPPVAAQPAVESGLSFKEKLKALMLELRDDPSPWRGGLSPEENQALRVLLRPERSLDPNNPWRDF